MISLPFTRKPGLMRTPTQSQEAAIRTWLKRKERELHRLDTDIVKFQHRLAQLSAQQQSLSEELESRRALIAPIRRLAPEILQEIFVRCLPVAHNAVMSARQAPLLLCRICHDWRQIAHATPHLWASIHIFLRDRTTSGPIPSPYDIITWLSRSKTLPLSISIDCPSYVSPHEGDRAKSYLDILTLLGNRWKSFHLSITSFDLVDYFNHFNGGDLPLLEKVHIDSTLDWKSEDYDVVDPDTNLPISFAEGFLRLPKLHSLSLPFDGFAPFRPSAQWDKLTQLEVIRPVNSNETYIGDLFQVLLSTPNLESCSISGLGLYSFGETASLISQKIDLPKLYSLSIVYCESFSGTWTVLKVLHAPRLRHLEYEIHTSPLPLPWSPGNESPSPSQQFFDAVSSFLSRLIQPLEELGLVIYPASSYELWKLLSLLPGLKRLALKRSVRVELHSWIDATYMAVIGDYHLRCFIPGRGLVSYQWNGLPSESEEESEHSQSLPGSPKDSTATKNCLCPNLKVFHCIGGSFCEGVLLDFLRSRSGLGINKAHVTPLKKVSIRSEGPLPDGIQEKVREILDGSGMLLDLISPSPAIPPPLPNECSRTYYGIDDVIYQW